MTLGQLDPKTTIRENGIMNPFDRINAIQAQANAEIEAIKTEALTELRDKLKGAEAIASDIRAEILKLTGESPRQTNRRAVSPKELVDLLGVTGELTGRALGVRLHATTTEVLATAKAHPDRFVLVKNGPQTRVKLV